MSRRRDPVGDLMIPASVLRHLEAIETELPRTPAWRPAGRGQPRLHVVRARVGRRSDPISRPRFAFEPLVAAVLVLVVGASFLVAGNQEWPGRYPTPTAPAFVQPYSPAPTPTATARRPAPIPHGGGPVVLVGNGDADAPTLIARWFRWSCRIHTDVADVVPDLRWVDKVADVRGVDSGWVPNESKVRIWFGTDPATAAAAFGAVLVARENATTWIAAGSGGGLAAHELLIERTPGGRLTWRLGDSQRPIACGRDLKTRAAETLLPTDRDGRKIVGFRIVEPRIVQDLVGRRS